MISPPTSESPLQLARKQGLARISAVTLGIGAASALGAVAIAVGLADSAPAEAGTSASAGAMTGGESTSESLETGSSALPTSPGASAAERRASTLRHSRMRAARLAARSQRRQRALALRITQYPPAATSGGS